jgi:6-phosphogluconate dehydrogenase
LAAQQGYWFVAFDLAAVALSGGPGLKSYSAFVEDSGEGRWMMMAALEGAVPSPGSIRLSC